MVVLGPSLGSVLFDASSATMLPEAVVHPEPAEQARYLLALLVPISLSCVVVAGGVRPVTAPPGLQRLGRAVTQASFLAVVVAAIAGQRAKTFGLPYTDHPFRQAYFTVPALLFAILFSCALGAVLVAPSALASLRRLAREGRAISIGCGVAAVLLTACWLLTAINTDGSIGSTNRAVGVNVPFWMGESYAILGGHTPLVDFFPQYGQLWPYLPALTMRIFGDSLAVYSTTLATITGVAMLAVYATFRRLTRSSPAALGLFVVFVSMSFFMMLGPASDRYGPANLLSLFPIRYAGPYLLAWLVARQLTRPLDVRGPLLLGTACTLVAINNPEFGIPAFVATVLAAAWGRPSLLRRGGGGWRTARAFGCGVAFAFALVTLLTLVRAGSLPHFGGPFRFSRLYAVNGWAMLPIPTVSAYLLLYLTFTAAIVVATVRRVRGSDDEALTGMVGWSGVFGLGAGAYYVGRSHPEVLVAIFSAWTFALALLLIVAVRSIVRRAPRFPSLAELVLFFGFGLAVAAIAQTPVPWTQIARIGDDTATPRFAYPLQQAFIESRSSPGESVAILGPMGHRIARDLELVNVLPFAEGESIASEEQFQAVIDALRAAGGTRIFAMSAHGISQSEVSILLREGFLAEQTPTDHGEVPGPIMFVDHGA